MSYRCYYNLIFITLRNKSIFYKRVFYLFNVHKSLLKNIFYFDLLTKKTDFVQ